MKFPSLDIDLEQLRVEIGAPSLCKHPKIRLCKKLDKNGHARLHNQCLDCGISVSPKPSIRTLTKCEIEKLPSFDERIQARIWDAFNERFKVAEQQKKDAIKEAWKECYDHYLTTPEWRIKRRLVLKRANGCCEGCMTQPAEEIHHLTYDNVGEEFLFQLVALCRDCHARLHAKMTPVLFEKMWDWLHYQKYGLDRWT